MLVGHAHSLSIGHLCSSHERVVKRACEREDLGQRGLSVLMCLPCHGWGGSPLITASEFYASLVYIVNSIQDSQGYTESDHVSKKKKMHVLIVAVYHADPV